MSASEAITVTLLAYCVAVTPGIIYATPSCVAAIAVMGRVTAKPPITSVATSNWEKIFFIVCFIVKIFLSINLEYY